MVDSESKTVTPNVPIPDNAYTGTLGNPEGFGESAGMVCVNLPFESRTVEDVELTVAIDHTWLGDLTVKVRSPAGTIVAPMVRPSGDGSSPTGDDGIGCCGDSSNLSSAEPITFRDGAARDAEDMGLGLSNSTIVTGEFSPNNDQAVQNAGSFSAFADEDAEGTWTVCVSDAAGLDTGTFVSATLTVFGPSDTPVEFAVVQQTVSEGAGSVQLEVLTEEPLAEPLDVTVTLTDGDPADLDGFTTTTVSIGGLGTPPPYLVTIPLADDALPEDDETFVLTLSVPEGQTIDGRDVVVGDRDQTALIVMDNDGPPVSVTVPPRDADGDDAEDGGFRVFSLPIRGVTVADVAAAAGASVVYVLDGDGQFVEADPATTLARGQIVLVNVEPDSDLTFTGSGGTGNTTYSTGGSGGRVLATVGNPTGRPIALSDITVAGGTVTDVALVFDSVAGSFRPVRLDDLDESALGAFDGVVLQIVPTGDPGDVTVTVAATAPESDAPPVGESEFTPSGGETAVVLALRPTASGAQNHVAEAPGDRVALRFLADADATLDASDAIDLWTPVGGTLSGVGPVGSDAVLAAASYGSLVRGTPVTIPLVVSVPVAGIYEIALANDPDDVDGRPIDVEVFDGTTGTFVNRDETVVFEATEAMVWPNALEGLFSVRVSLGAGVATDDDPALSAFEVYPNPASGTATVTLAVRESGPVRVAIYDVLGRQVAVAFDEAVASSARVDLDTAALTPGAYVVRVEGEGFVVTRRLTVIR